MTAFLQNIGDGTGYFGPKLLGNRTSGTAVQVTRTEASRQVPTDKEMVLKVLNLSDKDAEWRKAFSRVQIDALTQLRHPSLIVCHKAFEDPSEGMWFVEYDLFRCNLSAAVKNHDNKLLPKDKGKKWCKQIIEGMMFLHENNWPHRDLKMENILVTQADDVVITDFAFTHEQKTGVPNPLTGSLTYAAPEVLQHPLNCNPFKADIWALGVIFYAMHTDGRLFREETDKAVIEAEHNLLTFRIYEVGFSFFLKSLLINMMIKDPEQRMELKDMLQHPWFTGKTGGLESVSFDPAFLSHKGYLNPRAIGSGSFGIVYECQVKNQPDTRVAVKYINLSTVSDLFLNKLFMRERRALLRLQHKYLVPIHEIFSDKQEIQWFIVMDFCPSNLKLEARKFAHHRILEQVGRIWSRQIAEALKYLHDYRWVHRDIKIENVLINSRNEALLGDFTFARQQVRGSLSNTRCGSMRYIAPELTKKGNYDGFLADIWSLGCLIHAIHAGQPPIKEKRHLAKVWKEHKEVQSEIRAQNFSPSLTDLLSKILQLVPTDRLPLKQVLSHPWFQEGDPAPSSASSTTMTTAVPHRIRSESAPASVASVSHRHTSPSRTSSPQRDGKRKRSETDSAGPSSSKK